MGAGAGLHGGLRTAAVKWLKRTIREERYALECARRRFVRKPTNKRLHDLRTTARRLRSLLEDSADLTASSRLLRRVKRAAKATDAARDATVLLQLLERSIDESEREIARPLVEKFGVRERLAMERAYKHLRRTCFAP